MKRKSIEQLINKYALINMGTNEWIYEGSTYGVCVGMLSTLPPGTEYVIVAVMREGKTKKEKGENNELRKSGKQDSVSEEAGA